MKFFIIFTVIQMPWERVSFFNKGKDLIFISHSTKEQNGERKLSWAAHFSQNHNVVRNIVSFVRSNI